MSLRYKIEWERVYRESEREYNERAERTHRIWSVQLEKNKLWSVRSEKNKLCYWESKIEWETDINSGQKLKLRLLKCKGKENGAFGSGTGDVILIESY